MTETADQAVVEAWQGPEEPAPRRRFQPYSLSELVQLPRRNPLIKGLLDRGCMSVMYGNSNSGKTFLALDICLHVALGRAWLGRRVHQGRVLYVAAEGGFGLAERLRAFQIHHNVTNAPFYVISAAVNFRSSAIDVEEIMKEVEALGSVDLIVIDTLARAIAGGDENSPTDMGALVKNTDHLRQGTRAHVMIIHHTGKDSSKGARGHSSLRAAIDTEIAVTKAVDNDVTMEVTKQRDGKTEDKSSFKLKIVTLNHDEDGEPVTSCVLLPATVPGQFKGVRLNKTQSRALLLLDNLIIEKGQMGIPKEGVAKVCFVRISDFQVVLERGNISCSDKPDNVKKQISRIISGLNNSGFTETWEGKIWRIGQVGQ